MSPSRGVSKGAMHLSWSLLSCLLLLCLPTILLAAAQDCDSRSPGSEGVSSCNRDEERKEPFLGAQAPMENKYKMDSNAEMSSTTIQSASSKDASPSSTLSPKQNVPAPSTPKLSVDKQSIKPSGKPSIPKKQPHTERKSEKKDPFNYASFDCGALILASNPEAKEVSAILVNSKDRYMLNRCGTRHKWFEIEFCEEILVESISLANYELFSSTFKEFKVFVNNRYPSSPSHPWQLLGTFTSRNVRGKQVTNKLLRANRLRRDDSKHFYVFRSSRLIVPYFGQSISVLNL